MTTVRPHSESQNDQTMDKMTRNWINLPNKQQEWMDPEILAICFIEMLSTSLFLCRFRLYCAQFPGGRIHAGWGNFLLCILTCSIMMLPVVTEIGRHLRQKIDRAQDNQKITRYSITESRQAPAWPCARTLRCAASSSLCLSPPSEMRNGYYSHGRAVVLQ